MYRKVKFEVKVMEKTRWKCENLPTLRNGRLRRVPCRVSTCFDLLEGKAGCHDLVWPYVTLRDLEWPLLTLVDLTWPSVNYMNCPHYNYDHGRIIDLEWPRMTLSACRMSLDCERAPSDLISNRFYPQNCQKTVGWKPSIGTPIYIFGPPDLTWPDINLTFSGDVGHA